MKNETTIVARYAETDQMGIVHHSVYPIWFEVGRTNFIKMLGISYSQLENDGLMLPLAELSCQYIRPVHYEDEVTVETRVEKMSFAKVIFGYRVMLNGTLMTKGSTTHGFVDSETFRAVNLKKTFPSLYEKLTSAERGDNAAEISKALFIYTIQLRDESEETGGGLL